MAEESRWWDGTVNGVTVEWFNGNGYVRLNEYEALLMELEAAYNETEELKNGD